MDKVKGNLQKRALRVQENFQHSVGLSERKDDELQNLYPVEQRNQKMIAAVKNVKQNLRSCIRSGYKEEELERRKMKLEEFNLSAQLKKDADEFEKLPIHRNEHPVLSDVFNLYSKVINELLEERVRLDQYFEKHIINALTKYVDEEKAIAKAKERMAKTRVDVEVSRKIKAGNRDVSKDQDLQSDYDSLQFKLEGVKENIYADVYTLSSKETEIAHIFEELITAQVEFYGTAQRKMENALQEVTRTIEVYPRRPVFGCHLDDHLQNTHREIAVVLEDCCNALARHVNEQGLFRVSGNNNRIRRMKAAFDAHQVTEDEMRAYEKDPHSICSVLKSYLRELPEPLMTEAQYLKWVQIARKDPEARVKAVAELLSDIPENNRRNLAYLIRFLQQMLDHEHETMMGASNLSIVFGPNLIGSGADSESNNMVGSKLMETLLLNADVLFPNDVFNFNFVPSYTTVPSIPRVSNAGGFDEERVLPRATQLNASVQSSYSNSSIGYSGSVRRPRHPAPPPPAYGSLNSSPPPSYSSISTSTPVDEVTNSSEQFNSIVSKSPSVASNDSMTEYSYSNIDVSEDYSLESSMAYPSRESLTRPSRPPPPRNAQNTTSPSDSQMTQSFPRPISYMNAVNPPDISIEQSRYGALPVASSDENNRTILHLEADSPQGSSSFMPMSSTAPPASKPPLPAKPRTDLNPKEITKL